MATIESKYERNLKKPTYADKTKMTEAQADKTNTIIQSMYNQFVSKTTQPEITRIDSWQVTKRANSNVGEYHDMCYDQFCTLSFYFNSTGYTPSDRPVVFVIKPGYILSDISFVGVDDLNAPTDYLNNYGYFLFTYNDVMKEYFISFQPYADCPSKSWLVSMSFQYQAD